MSSLSPSMRRLLEIAGTIEHHEEAEHKLFHRACQVMSEVEAFCTKQHESNVYGPIAHKAKGLCDMLNAHLGRYKNMSDEKKHEIENK
jgi:hypothetical protein